MPLGAKYGGRAKGTPNKLTASVKDAVQKAFDAAGGAEYLERIAREDPKVFCALLARLIPTQVYAEVDLRPGLADMLAKARARVGK